MAIRFAQSLSRASRTSKAALNLAKREKASMSAAISTSAKRCMSVTNASTDMNKGTTTVRFSDGSKYAFHNMWLRDSCRDHAHITAVGERNLNTAPFIDGMDFKLPHIQVSPCGEGDLRVMWGEGSIPDSVVDAAWLRAYADVAGHEVEGPERALDADTLYEPLLTDFLEKDQGLAKERLNLFKNDGTFEIPRISYSELSCGSGKMSLWRQLVDPGVVIVKDMPEDVRRDGSVLGRFAQECFTGLQKHPLRQDAHWVISTEESVQMAGTKFSEKVEDKEAQNSYNTNQQLANHTDQVLYGTPGMLLMFHCAFGQGGNSITDGFAASYALRDREPAKYELLTKYGLNLGRRLEYYESGDMTFNVAKPVLQTDASGNLKRITYNEIYRTPLTVPFEEYPAYFEALQTWYSMVHSPEFQMHMTLKEGELIVFNNSRVMHGRAGLKGKARIIMGGTVTRDAFLNKVRQHYQDEFQVPDQLETGMPIDLYAKYGKASGL